MIKDSRTLANTLSIKIFILQTKFTFKLFSKKGKKMRKLWSNQ